MRKPLVSVIVPTRNSEDTLEKCLESIKSQKYPNAEIIVVDNYSNDRTREIAQKQGARILLHGPERGSQINFGVKNAKGKYVYRVDSDFVVGSFVIEEAVAVCELEGYDAVNIHNTSDSTVSFWSKVRKLERDCFKADDLNVGARFLRRDVFEFVGGFDEALVAAEDYDLQNRLLEGRFKVGRIKAEEIHIGEPKTLAEIVRKHYFYGKTIQYYIKKNPARAMKQLNPARLSYFKHKSMFLRNPTLSLGFAVYQFTRYLAAFIGLFTMRLGFSQESAK